ncbi:hypothetical protein PkP19E3_17205 [Pseudomonas koreensis]|nr:hypothetical protein PkP19E3_17205 [Pseudomonas koreensis]
MFCTPAISQGERLWRGSLLPLGCAAVANRVASIGAASQPSGSKLPRHTFIFAMHCLKFGFMTRSSSTRTGFALASRS